MTNRFDAENHKYYIDEIEVPSVSSLLPKQEYFVSADKLEELAKQGKDDHSMLKMFHDTGHTFNNPMLSAFQKWTEENKSIIGRKILWEKPIYSNKYKFAGTPDAIYERAIIDFKRSIGHKEIHALQLAAYHIAAMETFFGDTRPELENSPLFFILTYNGKKWNATNVYNNMAEVIFKEIVIHYHNIEAHNILINKYLEKK